MGEGTARPDRRARRREQTVEEALDQALEVMAQDGVAGLTMAALARRMSVQPPSVYKYFPSLLAVYDALFRRGQEQNLAALRAGMAGADPGLAAVFAGLQATVRWAVENPVLAQLLFWRPVPGFQPSADAFSPALAVIDLIRGGLTDAVALGQLAPAAASEDGMALLSTLHFGVLSQHLANDPDAPWDSGRFTRLHPKVLRMFVTAYHPADPPRGMAR